MHIKTTITTSSMLPVINFNQLEFGRYTADHMFVADYEEGEWQKAAIVPYAELSLNPATLALHYGQTIFEGMKAFRMDDGNISIFRIQKHHTRFQRSAERMSMQAPSFDLFNEALQQLIAVDQAWVPSNPGALYIRPFIIATEARFGVKVSSSYKFIIITGPVPELYGAPVRLKLESKFIRAARGGTGAAKCGGNYGASFYPGMIAKSEGYDQVLWTDVDHQYIEESGMMNIMFVINKTLVTPALSDSILDGVTRDSLIMLAKESGIAVEERPITVHELERGLRDGNVTEAFGVGTAAVVSPVGLIGINGYDYTLPPCNDDSTQSVLRAALDRVRTGQDADRFGWNTIVNVSADQLRMA